MSIRDETNWGSATAEIAINHGVITSLFHKEANGEESINSFCATCKYSDKAILASQSLRLDPVKLIE